MTFDNVKHLYLGGKLVKKLWKAGVCIYEDGGELDFDVGEFIITKVNKITLLKSNGETEYLIPNEYDILTIPPYGGTLTGGEVTYSYKKKDKSTKKEEIVTGTISEGVTFRLDDKTTWKNEENNHHETSVNTRLKLGVFLYISSIQKKTDDPIELDIYRGPNNVTEDYNKSDVTWIPCIVNGSGNLIRYYNDGGSAQSILNTGSNSNYFLGVLLNVGSHYYIYDSGYTETVEDDIRNITSKGYTTNGVSLDDRDPDEPIKLGSQNVQLSGRGSVCPIIVSANMTDQDRTLDLLVYYTNDYQSYENKTITNLFSQPKAETRVPEVVTVTSWSFVNSISGVTKNNNTIYLDYGKSNPSTINVSFAGGSATATTKTIKTHNGNYYSEQDGGTVTYSFKTNDYEGSITLTIKYNANASHTLTLTRSGSGEISAGGGSTSFTCTYDGSSLSSFTLSKRSGNGGSISGKTVSFSNCSKTRTDGYYITVYVSYLGIESNDITVYQLANSSETYYTEPTISGSTSTIPYTTTSGNASSYVSNLLWSQQERLHWTSGETEFVLNLSGYNGITVYSNSSIGQPYTGSQRPYTVTYQTTQNYVRGTSDITVYQAALPEYDYKYYLTISNSRYTGPALDWNKTTITKDLISCTVYKVCDKYRGSTFIENVSSDPCTNYTKNITSGATVNASDTGGTHTVLFTVSLSGYTSDSDSITISRTSAYGSKSSSISATTIPCTGGSTTVTVSGYQYYKGEQVNATIGPISYSGSGINSSGLATNSYAKNGGTSASTTKIGTASAKVTYKDSSYETKTVDILLKKDWYISSWDTPELENYSTSYQFGYDETGYVSKLIDLDELRIHQQTKTKHWLESNQSEIEETNTTYAGKLSYTDFRVSDITAGSYKTFNFTVTGQGDKIATGSISIERKAKPEPVLEYGTITITTALCLKTFDPDGGTISLNDVTFGAKMDYFKRQGSTEFGNDTYTYSKNPEMFNVYLNPTSIPAKSSTDYENDEYPVRLYVGPANTNIICSEESKEFTVTRRGRNRPQNTTSYECVLLSNVADTPAHENSNILSSPVYDYSGSSVFVRVYEIVKDYNNTIVEKNNVTYGGTHFTSVLLGSQSTSNVKITSTTANGTVVIARTNTSTAKAMINVVYGNYLSFTFEVNWKDTTPVVSRGTVTFNGGSSKPYAYSGSSYYSSFTIPMNCTKSGSYEITVTFLSSSYSPIKTSDPKIKNLSSSDTTFTISNSDFPIYQSFSYVSVSGTWVS